MMKTARDLQKPAAFRPMSDTGQPGPFYEEDQGALNGDEQEMFDLEDTYSRVLKAAEAQGFKRDQYPDDEAALQAVLNLAIRGPMGQTSQGLMEIESLYRQFGFSEQQGEGN